MCLAASFRPQSFLSPHPSSSAIIDYIANLDLVLIVVAYMNQRPNVMVVSASGFYYRICAWSFETTALG
jgi:hypothetical protein